MSTTKRKKGGRPLKLTPEVQKNICTYIKEGNYLDTACKLAGVDYSTFRRWIVLGENEQSGKFYEFSEAVKLAEAQAENERIKLILKAGQVDDWKANAWYLERRYPDKWGKRERVDANIKSEHVSRQEHLIEQHIESDPQTMALVKELWRRKQEQIGEM